MNSCTAALHLSLLTAGVGPGDEVVTTPLTFCSTVNVILHVGAVPVLADIDPATHNLDPSAAEAAVTANATALLPVHYSGRPAAIAAFRQVSRAAGPAARRGRGALHRGGVGCRQSRRHRRLHVLQLLRDQERQHRRRRHGDHREGRVGLAVAGGRAARHEPQRLGALREGPVPPTTTSCCPASSTT